MPSINLETKPSTEPVHAIRLGAPPLPHGSANSAQVFLPAWDVSSVEVSGVLQCTAIFIRNSVTGARYAAHFGGWANNRRPKPNEMRSKVHRVIFDPGLMGGHRLGFAHIAVTICKNGSSPQHSLAEAEQVLRAVIPGSIPIVRAKAPGERFFFDSQGRVFGSPA